LTWGKLGINGPDPRPPAGVARDVGVAPCCRTPGQERELIIARNADVDLHKVPKCPKSLLDSSQMIYLGTAGLPAPPELRISNPNTLVWPITVLKARS
jgi:hypothetical protein